MSKKCKENSNISCDAVNCMYHVTDHGCTAESIKVSNCNACSCTDTCCATFKMKDASSKGI
ncbi:MAG: DUF1540 domain-containing protein [Clostridia bacterium]|nr:DUF1540 domain-containing protein [Clostridia bacterium]